LEVQEILGAKFFPWSDGNWNHKMFLRVTSCSLNMLALTKMSAFYFVHDYFQNISKHFTLKCLTVKYLRKCFKAFSTTAQWAQLLKTQKRRKNWCERSRGISKARFPSHSTHATYAANAKKYPTNAAESTAKTEK